ncbi:MAG: chemotaxis protein CheC [Firmicutes bacterium]|nr:chemotaxis protein CheC [Bacillota bacterium]
MSEGSRLYDAISIGFGEAGRVLRLMVPIEVTVSTPEMKPVRIEDIPCLLGSAEKTVVATYSRVRGDISGHLAFLYDPGTARRLATLVTGEAEPDDEMSASAICEVSNVAGSRVLSVLSDATGLRIVPTAPVLVSDMAGAILQSTLYDLAPVGKDAVVTKTEIRLAGEDAAGLMVLIPTGDGVSLLAERLGN